MIILIFHIGCSGLYVFKCGEPSGLVITARKQYEALIIPPLKDGSMMQYAPELNTLMRARYQDAGSDKTVAVIGDSHAQSAFPGIAEKNKNLNMNTVLMDFNPRTPEKKREAALNVLKSRNDITHIFVFLRGVLYLTGNDIDDEFLEDAPKDKFKPFLQKIL